MQKVYTIEVSKLFCFIFMEFAPNGTLADYIRRNGPTPEWIARSMVKRVVKALLYLHSRGIAHRDLKLENILLDKRSNPKLTDFSYSLVCIRDPETGAVQISKTFCGSIPYMAPELLTQKPYDPKKADIWSLGICIFILMNDRIPFDPGDVAKMIKAQLNKEFEFRKKIEAIVTDECKDFIRKMLEPLPKVRPSCEELNEHRWFTIERNGSNKPNVLISRID
ncbi:testis-specific serine/threonine-protein kinase 2-like [Brevipalpus obovatus]|uniref:testis-specific serine/threonine-protein kinase 2-like n=1 Tax=Brevipalpus obovatus TaxID=246614 RepID=UPI003D9EDED2